MTEIGDTTQNPKMARIQGFLTSRRGVLRDYFTAISGSAGRLVFSLAYFVALANTLSFADFGLFATASAAGVMLSRILAFGFIGIFLGPVLLAIGYSLFLEWSAAEGRERENGAEEGPRRSTMNSFSDGDPEER